ncbi:MAG: efflux RND transporter periplasmic adaptor subunit [Rhodospirillales bacterium]|nr:efflux RND transporter periplasmic adaptor subunit [Rhodospirillales bacterium]
MNLKEILIPMAKKAVVRFNGLEPAYKTAIVIALLAFVWMASGVFKSADEKDAGDPSASALPRVRVTTLQSQPHTPYILLMGRTQAGLAVSVRTEIPGRVLEVVAQKGQFVEAGAVLLRIDPEDRAQRLAEAKARMKQREIAYESAQKLSKGGYSSQLNVALALADLEASRALVTRVERELENAAIAAPFAGVVDAIPVEVGDYFDKAGQIAARVLDLGTIKAVAQVSESDINRVAQGGKAMIRLPDGRELEGRVSFVGMSSNALTRTFPVEVTAEVANHDVPEGVTAEIRLPMETIVGHKISPALLTLDDQGKIGVKIINAQSQVEFYPVGVASDTIDGAWLTGLPDSVRIITVGQEFVRVGETVETVEGLLDTMHKPEGNSPQAKPEN